MAAGPVKVLIHGTHSDLVAFLVLSIWPSHLGLPLLLTIIFLSKNIQRHPTFVSMCITWIITGFASSILLYAGKATGPEPSKMLCLTQASLLYGTPPMNAMSAFLLVFQMFMVMNTSFKRGETATPDSPLYTFAMVAPSYIIFLFFALATAFVGASHPEHLSRNRRFFYCSLHSSQITDTLTLISAAILLVTLVFEIWIIVILYKHYRALKQQGPHLRSPIELSFPIRIVIFGIYVVLGMCLSFINVDSPSSPAPDLILSTTSSAVVLLFGTQQDILRVLCFWHRPRLNDPPPDHERKSSSSEKPFNAP